MLGGFVLAAPTSAANGSSPRGWAWPLFSPPSEPTSEKEITAPWLIFSASIIGAIRLRLTAV